MPLVTMPTNVESEMNTPSSAKMVSIMEAPDYIPNLSSAVIHSSSSGTKPSKLTKSWGRVKQVSEIFEEFEKEESETASNEPSETPRHLGLDGFQKTAKIFMQSKRAVKRIRDKYSARSINARRSSILDLADISGELLDMDMFSNYDLERLHKKLRQQKQLKLAFLQKKFINDLPTLKESSVQDHLQRKLQALERIKTSHYVVDALNPPVPTEEEPKSPKFSDTCSRRQSKLRQSIDLSNNAAVLTKLQESLNEHRREYDNENGKKLPKVTITTADVQREMAVFKSREQIEKDLKLPPNRLARFAILRANVDKLNDKFNRLRKGNRVENDGQISEKSEEDKTLYVPSRFTHAGMATNFFRKYARIVLIVTQWISMIMDKQYDFEKELKSFVDIANEIEDQAVSSSMSEFGITFDKKQFKANREISLSNDVRKILTTRWQSRTPAMIKQVMNGLQSLKSLSEYPIDTQEKLCKVAWYQTIGPKKLIVRQGHHAESFYFILSGIAFVKKMIEDPVTGDPKAQVAARLTKGHSFGEIGLLFDTLRTATVESATAMELLVIGKEDFVRIFMKAENPDDEPDHVKFLKKIPFMTSWPTEVLKLEAGACLTHYFKRGTLITDNDRHSEWIYIVMNGSCEVLKKLKAVKGRDPKSMKTKSNPMSDIILPELGVSTQQPKIDTGKMRVCKQTIDPDVFRDMTDFYDSLRRKYISELPKSQPPASTKIDDDNNDDVTELPEQADTQLPKLFLRTASARKFSIERTPRVRFLDEKQKTESDMMNVDMKLLPLKVPEDGKRPLSRARFDENLPKLQTDHFRLPSRERLQSLYRPVSRSSEHTTVQQAEDVFVKVDLLHARHCFGLNTLKYVLDEDDEVFDVGSDETPILSLVSRGAEVVMLSKKVFLKYADNKCKLRVRDQIKVYPPEHVMQDNMQLEADWSVYKESLLSSYVDNKLKQTVRPRCHSTNY